MNSQIIVGRSSTLIVNMRSFLIGLHCLLFTL